MELLFGPSTGRAGPDDSNGQSSQMGSAVMQVITQDVRQDSLTMLTGAAGPFEAVSAKPLKGPISPTDLTTFAAANALAADFTGSTPILIVWSAIIVASNRQPFKSSQLLNWIATAAPDPVQNIYGVMYYNGTDLIGVDVFDAPVAIAGVGDSVQWVATVP